MEQSREGDDVPLLTRRSNVFEGVDPGIKQKKSMKDRLPFKKKVVADVKYGPNRTVYFNDPEANASQAEELKYSNNVITTSQYTLLTFLPVNMYEQFRKVANLYFLVVTVLILIPQISPVQPYGSIAALAFVIGVSAIRAAVEDIKRHREDAKVNSTQCAVLQGEQWNETVPWRDLQVGDIVRVDQDQYFPADLLLVNSSEPNGMAFVNTMNLDGETNTKPKQAPAPLHKYRAEMELAHIAGMVKSEGPNKNLESYTGTLVLEGGETALDNRNILYRGCQLVTARYCYGLVLFTGKQTKLMKNNIKVRLKRTKLDKMLNKSISLVFLMLLAVCLIGAIGMAVNVSDNAFHGYLQWTMGAPLASILNFLTYVILFSGMVPISLYVSVEMVKVVQALLIDMDHKMYYEPNDTPAKAKTSALSEELGQISYIFSDKTGTLTRNEMEFKKCCVNGKSYGLMGDDAQNVAPVSTADPEFGFRDPQIEGDLAKSPQLQEFWRLLSVCHTVLVEELNGKIHYNAESPDEAALVKAASEFGFVFKERVTTAEGSFLLVDIAGKAHRYQLLNVLEFNSTRKRMSVVVREMFGANRLLLYTKGADNIIKERLAPGQQDLVRQTDGHLEQYAQIGLRTLMLGVRALDANWYAAWQAKFHEASTALDDRAAKVDAVSEEMEKQLTLVGATAIEDKLQEGVPETIAQLAEAGIKIWVLTGDKKDTAINIGFSCKLLLPHYRLIVIDAEDWHQTQLQLKDALDRYIRVADPLNEIFSLVIEGKTLHHALEPENRLHLLALATSCKSVICCRVSPKQKAEVVELVKKTLGQVCLSIGDGANDVSMIREAHIGVGISGHEGRQAVMAADYAIAQFRFLGELLLVHGRWSYKRIAFLVKYSFYKNFVHALVQIWFALFNKFSGQTMFDSWMLAFYNLIFTSLPIMFFAVLDRDVKKKTARALPALYETGLHDHEFNVLVFLSWLARGIVESFVIFFVCYQIWYVDVLGPNGQNSGLWAMGVCAYTCTLLVVNGKLALHMNTWTLHQLGIILLSLTVWFVFIFIYGLLLGNATDRSLLYVAQTVIATWTFWFTVFLVVALCLVPEFIFLSVRRHFFPENYQIAQFLQHDTALIRRLLERHKPLPPRYKKITVLEMARSLEGIDPEVAYSGFAYSGTSGGRLTLALAQGIKEDNIKF